MSGREDLSIKISYSSWPAVVSKLLGNNTVVLLFYGQHLVTSIPICSACDHDCFLSIPKAQIRTKM